MSGIVGIFYRNGRPVEKSSLEQMTETLAHRGSDRRSVWHSESVGMGHCLLHTTPESLLERQPTVDRSGNVITADLRLDNRDELIAILGFASCDRDKITDSELVLAAYQKWGEDCPDRLLGDFAFAIWDAGLQQLFCARDHYGIKQLYYYCTDAMMVFASEIKALFCWSEVPRRLNEVKVADYLIPLLEDREITFYQGIYRLPPAHSLTVGRTKVRLQQYWNLDPERNIVLGSDAEYAEAFREIFTEAVHCRMRSSFPVGTFLSGGLDSSSITCVARDLLDRQRQPTLPTFSAVFDRVTECDESPYINAVVEQGDIEPHFIAGDRIGSLTDWSQVTWHQDEAYYAPNLFLHCAIYRAAQQQQDTDLLDGFDGDTTVSHGIAYIAELALAGNWLYLVPEVRGVAQNFGQSFWFTLWRHGIRPNISPKLELARRKILAKTQKPPSPNICFQGEFAQRIQLKQRIRDSQQGSGLPKTSRDAHYRCLSAGVVPFSLEVADRAAAAYGIEPRYPFFDKRLIEFCLALPAEQKIRRGWTRLVMRRAMEGILPPKIQWRGGKSNLGSNFHHGLKLGKEQLDRVMAEDLAYIENYLDLATLRSLYQRFSAGEAISHDEYLAIWKSLSLTLWLKQTRISA